MAKDREQRYASARLLASDLERMEAELQLSSHAKPAVSIPQDENRTMLGEDNAVASPASATVGCYPQDRSRQSPSFSTISPQASVVLPNAAQLPCLQLADPSRSYSGWRQWWF